MKKYSLILLAALTFGGCTKEALYEFERFPEVECNQPNPCSPQPDQPCQELSKPDSSENTISDSVYIRFCNNLDLEAIQIYFKPYITQKTYGSVEQDDCSHYVGFSEAFFSGEIKVLTASDTLRYEWYSPSEMVKLSPGYYTYTLQRGNETPLEVTYKRD